MLMVSLFGKYSQQSVLLSWKRNLSIAFLHQIKCITLILLKLCNQYKLKICN